jgi:hypothetical protein
MIDHDARFTNVVKDAVVKECQAHGIDAKSEAGWWVGGHGQLQMIVTDNGPMVAPAWVVGLTLRSLMLVKGAGPTAGTRPVLGTLPPDADFRAAVRQLVTEVDQARRNDLENKPKNDGKIDPSQVIEIPKGRMA